MPDQPTDAGKGPTNELPKLTRQQYDFLREQLGEGFHVALRKASDHHEADAAWHAIHRLPNNHWGAVLDFVMWGIFGDRPKKARPPKGDK